MFLTCFGNHSILIESQLVLSSSWTTFLNFLAALSESSCWRDKRTSHGAFHFNLPVTAANLTRLRSTELHLSTASAYFTGSIKVATVHNQPVLLFVAPPGILSCRCFWIFECSWWRQKTPI
jgi:hypothetical protein